MVYVLAKSFGGKLASLDQQPARVPPHSVFALAGAVDVASVQVVFVGTIWEQHVHLRRDVDICVLSRLSVAREHPDLWEARVVIAVVLDGVRDVVRVDDPSMRRGRHVWHAVVSRRSPVHAFAVFFAEASGLGAVTLPVAEL